MGGGEGGGEGRFEVAREVGLAGIGGRGEGFGVVVDGVGVKLEVRGRFEAARGVELAWR